MSTHTDSVKSIFLGAVETPAADREAYVAAACGDDAELRRDVEELLRHHPQVGEFLESPAVAAAPTIDMPGPFTEGPGTVIGPYKLLEQIGEGGFGAVFMAEQERPVRRRVALKLIKPGMDTQDVIARFEAERQALALMDHPNIARVFDAGATPSGRPYFVMELVKGVPITEYCDRCNLGPRERLELFATVCQAVQHAHQKGVIHRDIKPSNVLVTLLDGRPVPKVIDFGLAKAMHQRLTDKTLFTQFDQMLGTPLYMSPEQAEHAGLDIDTRSDVYSLGAMLYELLTGSTPFMRQRLRDAALGEILRMIREEEPPRPSLRLSSMGDKLPGIAAHRHTEPKKLGALLRGELDWIVMKALEKDRARRYETANGFAADILRYLNDEPVLACPPSATYPFRKFARRNKRALAATSLVVLALIAGTVVSTWQAMRATRAEGLARTRLVAETRARTDAVAARKEAETNEAEARQQKTRAQNALAEVEQQRQRAEVNFDKARRAVDEYLTQVTESELLTVPGLQPLRQDLLEAARKFYAEFTQERAADPTLRRELASANYRLGIIQRELGNDEAFVAANAEAIRLFEQLRDQGNVDRDVKLGLARACFVEAAEFAKRSDARMKPRCDETVELCQDILQAEPGHAEARSLLADTYNALAIAADDKGDLETALKHHQQAFELREALVRGNPDRPEYLAELGGTVNNLGTILTRHGKTAEALAMYERGVEYSAQAYEREPHSMTWGRWLCIGLRNVAGTHAASGQQQEALASYQRLVAVSRKRAFENPAVTSLRADLYESHLLLAQFQRQLGNTDEAARSFRDARDVLENIPRETPGQLYELAAVYAALAQPAEGAIPPDQEDAAERQRNIELALQTLRKAADAGYTNVQTLKADRLFDVMRARDDFQRLVAGLDKAAQAQQLASRSAGNPDQNLANRLQAAQLLQDLVTEQPDSVGHKRTLAATLHSVGVIQTGLKQFDEAETSLLQALEMRDAVRQQEPGKPERIVDWMHTRIAIGSLHWARDRRREAHLLWKELLPDIEQLKTLRSAGKVVVNGSQIYGLEIPICQAYLELGLWEEVAAHLAASAGEQPPPIARGHATIKLLHGDEAGYRELCARFVDRSAQGQTPYNQFCLATACLMSPEVSGDVDRWIEVTREY
ncbi:MAG: protein kinase, partial [Planctomycetes bacterium]|nr:protein kinase [Planctomycetota bacterium]